MELALGLADGQVVDAGEAQLHQALVVNLPVLVAVAAKPLACGIAPFVGEAHGDAVAGVGPEFLDQPIVLLALPLAGEKRADLLTADRELAAITPAAVERIGQGPALGLAAVPALFRHA